MAIFLGRVKSISCFLFEKLTSKPQENSVMLHMKVFYNFERKILKIGHLCSVHRGYAHVTLRNIYMTDDLQ